MEEDSLYFFKKSMEKKTWKKYGKKNVGKGEKYGKKNGGKGEKYGKKNVEKVWQKKRGKSMAKKTWKKYGKKNVYNCKF